MPAMSGFTDSFTPHENSPPEGALLHGDASAEDVAHAPEPTFVLLDDAGGRFAIDPDTGVVTLASDDLLQTDFGQIFEARLRGRELTGDIYEMSLRLCITGHVPKIADSAFNDAFQLPPMTPPEFEAAPAPPAPKITIVAPELDLAPTGAAHFPLLTYVDSAEIACSPLAEDEPFGALRLFEASDIDQIAVDVALPAPTPAPASAAAHWLI